MQDKLGDYIMKLTVVSAVCLSLVIACLGNGQESNFETRCGWFSNPTPANIWLYDRDGEWIIGTQGGHQVENDWDWPVFKPRQWVRTNGNYGYGCACLEVSVNKETREVVEIKRARARPLSVCRQDRALKKWKP